MDAALETLMLVFAGEACLKVPERALFIGARAHGDFHSWPEIVGWQPFKPAADEWDRGGLRRGEDVPAGLWPVVLVLPGKSRDETLAWFALAWERLLPGGRIIVAMPNTAGAGRFEKELAQAAGNITSIQKHKCRAFHAVKETEGEIAVFDAWKWLGGFREMPGTGFVTLAGIFSVDHIDPGSRLLAEHLPANLRGTVADLGAGWGYLTDCALRRCPAVERIDLYEADRRALACAERNLAEHKRDIRFHWADVTCGLEQVYDVILMNPPFHTGQATDVDLGQAFLRVAAAGLRRGGRLMLVANRQLPYESTLDALKMAWRKVAEDATYKILFAEKRQ